ncbi:MAG TPA: hypothetical protein PLB91_09110 [Spirochaetales bacterium]|nr:hypothetical protein [Spirochaetales bacterium]HRY54803.1 hypothetical protein [Spirochaetia bacterium]HRZ65524.1 hypothetical protein [Spirochaetia bacterium]
MPKNRFTHATWKRLSATMASGFAMDRSRAEAFAGNPTAKLIGALPFLAGCRAPERCALAHLAVFVLGGASGPARELFDHAESDDYDVLARLSSIASFDGGDPALIARGMKLLAIVMIAGYKKDLAADRAAGRYNPLGAGAWDAEALLRSLRSQVEAIPAPEMDEILGLDAALRGYWE